MASRGLILLCLYAIVTFSHAAPPQNTLVINKSDHDPPPVTDVPPAEMTTEEPPPPIKLTEMDVRSMINMRYAHTAIVTKVKNPANRSQEATFRVLLPETAFISGFVMILDGKSYKAYVKEKEEAKNIYNQAVSQGYGAAHISAKARDSNIFTVSVNVEPKSVAVFNLTYEELLVRRNGVYNHAVNLHPGALVPKLTVTIQIHETQKITKLRVPEVRTGNEIDANEGDAQNKNAVIDLDKSERKATVTFTPDLEEQKSLIAIYQNKSKERRQDNYGYGYEEAPQQDGILGQFVVQYDVDRSVSSNVLVNDGYFVHFFAPTSLPPLSKHVVFVLDTSGSMSGRKIDQLIAAMHTILENLHKDDVFNIVQFESSVKVLDILSASASSPPPTHTYSYYQENAFEIPPLLPPVEVTPENIAKAKLLVSRLTAGGGTNIGTALDVAISLVKKASKEDNPNVTSTSDADIKEPIVIFLTDGEPTVGEGNPSRIIRIVTEKNYGKNNASIYSLAFGQDADRSFLRKLSLKNDGFMRHIYSDSDASLQLRDFYRQISSPILANVTFMYPPEQVKEGSLTKNKFRRFYDGSETIVAGRIDKNIRQLNPHITAICGVGSDAVGRKTYQETAKGEEFPDRASYLPLERMWAYLTIQQLLDERDIADISDNDENSPGKKALKLALQYEFVTSLTSLVVVKPNATSAVDTESIHKESPVSAAFPSFLQSNAPPRGLSAVNKFAAQLSGVSYSDSISAGFGLPGPDSAPLLPSSDAVLFLRSEAYGSLSISGMPGGYGVLSSMGPIPLSGLPTFDYVVDEEEGKTSFVFPKRHMKNASPARHRNRHITKTVLAHRSNADIALTTPVQATTTTSPLEEFNLSAFSWTEPLLNSSSNCITLQVNGTQVDLKLYKDANLPESAKGDAECSKATDDATGLCVYLTRCYAARNITADIYARTYCLVGDNYAGVCCPRSEVDKTQSD